MSTIDKRFIINRQGKDFVLYAGLLDLATTTGLQSIEVEALQITATLAVFKATASFADGRRFSSHGDASPDNVGRTIAPHFIRMAETRSKARALRDALNIGAVALEELGPDDEATAAAPPPLVGAPRPIRPPAPPRPPPAAPLTPAAVAARHAEDEEMGDANADIRSVATYVHGDEPEPTGELPGPRRGSQPPPPAVPGDDVEQLSGEALAEACRRLDVLLKASGVPVAPYPKKPASAAAWRAWWRTGQATLAAIPRPVNVRAEPAPQAAS